MLRKSDSAALLHCVTRLWQSSCAGSTAEGVVVAKKKVKPRKTTKKSVPMRPKKKESLNVGYGALKGLANFGELFGLGLSSSPVHVSGRYVWRGTPAFLVTNLSGEAATTTLFNWGYWPIPGYSAEFTKQQSVVWVRDTNVLHRYALEDINQVNYFGAESCSELESITFPKSADEATTILGGFLDVELFDPEVHTFDEGVLDNVESFEKQWKSLAKLKPGKFAEKSSPLSESRAMRDVEYLTEKALTPEIAEFLSLAGPPLVDFEGEPNDWFLEEFGEDARWELSEALSDCSPWQYELVWQTEESMKRYFWQISAATLLSLPHLIAQDIVKGRVADLGSGMGLASCFMAWNWPECHVTAIELTTNGNIRAKEIAKKLGISNIEFINEDLGDIEQVKRFDLVTTFLTAHEIGALNKLHEIYGHDSHSDKFAAINLEKYQSAYAQFVGDLLNDDGSVFSVERLGHKSEQCAWIGGLRNAGVYVDLKESTFVYPFEPSWGHRERLPVFVGSRQETDLSMESFDNWYNRHPFGKDVD